ncbi:MAG: hypothetical protein WC824_05700 [Bacteroidota bacterium]|jgi:hypothetical protein
MMKHAGSMPLRQGDEKNNTSLSEMEASAESNGRQLHFPLAAYGNVLYYSGWNTTDAVLSR